MNRDKAIRALAAGYRTVEAFNGASSAWQGMKTAKTASQLMSIGAEKLTGSPGAGSSVGPLIVGAMMSGLISGLVAAFVSRRIKREGE